MTSPSRRRRDRHQRREAVELQLPERDEQIQRPERLHEWAGLSRSDLMMIRKAIEDRGIPQDLRPKIIAAVSEAMGHSNARVVFRAVDVIIEAVAAGDPNWRNLTSVPTSELTNRTATGEGPHSESSPETEIKQESAARPPKKSSHPKVETDRIGQIRPV